MKTLPRYLQDDKVRQQLCNADTSFGQTRHTGWVEVRIHYRDGVPQKAEIERPGWDVPATLKVRPGNSGSTS